MIACVPDEIGASGSRWEPSRPPDQQLPPDPQLPAAHPADDRAPAGPNASAAAAEQGPPADPATVLVADPAASAGRPAAGVRRRVAAAIGVAGLLLGGLGGYAIGHATSGPRAGVISFDEDAEGGIPGGGYPGYAPGLGGRGFDRHGSPDDGDGPGGSVGVPESGSTTGGGTGQGGAST